MIIIRNPNSYGSCYKLSGNRRRPWVARKTIGWKDNGQPIYAFIGYYATKADAMIALAEYNKDPYDIIARGLTFGELYNKWSAEHFRKISDSSVKSYVAAYKACTDVLDKPVKDLKLDHLQAVLDRSGKNTPTLKNIKNMIGQMYDYAVIHELLPADRREMVR